jgi:hypothetical protein
MINEKTYLKLMHRLPVVKCPEHVVSQVLRVCDTSTGFTKKSPGHLLREMTYGAGCLIILAVIFLMCKYSYDNQSEYHTRIAVNSHLLVRQLANGASIIFTEKIK